MTDCTQCGLPNDSGDSNVCRGCLIARNFPPAPTSTAWDFGYQRRGLISDTRQREEEGSEETI